MEHLIHSDDLKIARFFPTVRVRRVDQEEFGPYDPQGLSFFNMNTPEEFARAEEWWRQLSAAR